MLNNLNIGTILISFFRKIDSEFLESGKISPAKKAQKFVRRKCRWLAIILTIGKLYKYSMCIVAI